MTIRFPFFLFALCTCLVANAQHDDRQRLPPELLQQIKAQKVAFITQYLHLTPDEAKVFWPIYDQYEGQLHTVRSHIRQVRRTAAQDTETLTDAQAGPLLEQELEAKKREMEIDRERILKIREAVGAKKALLLGRADREFTRQLFKRMRHNGGEREGPSRGTRNAD